MNNFSEIFKRKYLSKQLAHFYILNGTTSKDKVDSWPSDNLSTILKDSNSKFDYENHPDILIIRTKLARYTLKSGEFEDVFNFLATRPMELTRKFIIIHEAHKISEIISNKLLKTFEEPEVDTTIILLNDLKSALLPTIKSRAIQINISSSAQDTQKEKSYKTLLEYSKSQNTDTAKIISDYLTRDSESVILEAIKKKSFNEEDFLELASSWCTINSNSFLKSSAMLESIKEFQKFKEFNNPMQHRVISLIHAIK